MIVELLMDFLHGLATALFSWASSLIPAPPSWLADLNSGIATVVGTVPESVRWFVPLGPAVTVGLSLVTLFLVAGSIRLGRRVLSLFTGGGGNA